MDSEFDVDFKSSKTTHKFLRKGEGKRASNVHADAPRHPFLKKGAGKLASDNHGETEFAKKRKEQVINEQYAREAAWRKKNPDW